jgi:hypothetical protein
MQTAAQPQGGRGAKSDTTGCQTPHFTMVLVPGLGRLNEETDAHARARFINNNWLKMARW